MEGSPTRRIDIRPLRQFFLGVLGWTPQTVMREASLQDLQDAWMGFTVFHGIGGGKNVSAQFLAEMMKRFPDGKGEVNDDKKT